MFDDDICSATDMKRLGVICKDNGLVRCDRCDHSEPNAGYDVPYCTKLGKDKDPYKLKKGNIPKKCKYWLSEKKMLEKRKSARKIIEAQRAIDILSPSEKSKIKM